MTRVSTPRRCAAITASSSSGSENTNILMRIDFAALLTASIIGWDESSGNTIKERDILKVYSPGQTFLRHKSIRPSVELRPMQPRINPILRHQLLVRTVLRHHASANHHNLIGIPNRTKPMRN